MKPEAAKLALDALIDSGIDYTHRNIDANELQTAIALDVREDHVILG